MPLKNPKISVVMNCYNSATYLKESIQSVLDQTFTEWEIVFWDNQSTDHSAKIVKSFKDKRIRYFYAGKHTGLGEARNLAIQKTRANWVAFLDCDDLWLPEKLKKQYEIIKEEEKNKTNLGLVYCKTTVFGENVKESEPALINALGDLPEGFVFYEYLLTTNFIPLLSAVINKKIFLSTGGIPVNYIQAEDYFLFAAIAKISKVRAVKETLCRYRVHGSNMTKKQKIISVTENIEILNFWKNEFEKDLKLLRRWKKKNKILLAMEFIFLIQMEKNWQEALKLLFRENIVLEIFCFVLLRKEY